MSYLKAASLWSVGEIKGNLEKSYSFVEKNFSFSDWFSRWDTWRTIKIYFLRFLVNFYAKKKLSFLKLSLPWDDDDTLHHAFTYPGLLPTWRDLDLLFFQRAFSLVFSLEKFNCDQENHQLFQDEMRIEVLVWFLRFSFCPSILMTP